jgi:hypothetical protein
VLCCAVLCWLGLHHVAGHSCPYTCSALHDPDLPACSSPRPTLLPLCVLLQVQQLQQDPSHDAQAAMRCWLADPEPQQAR